MHTFTYHEAIEQTQEIPQFKNAWEREKFYIFNPTPFMVWVYTKFPLWAIFWFLGFASFCEKFAV